MSARSSKTDRQGRADQHHRDSQAGARRQYRYRIRRQNQLQARINYRCAIKMAIQSTMRRGAEGIKVRIAGRLNGSDMAPDGRIQGKAAAPSILSAPTSIIP